MCLWSCNALPVTLGGRLWSCAAEKATCVQLSCCVVLLPAATAAKESCPATRAACCARVTAGVELNTCLLLAAVCHLGWLLLKCVPVCRLAVQSTPIRVLVCGMRLSSGMLCFAVKKVRFSCTMLSTVTYRCRFLRFHSSRCRFLFRGTCLYLNLILFAALYARPGICRQLHGSYGRSTFR